MKIGIGIGIGYAAGAYKPQIMAPATVLQDGSGEEMAFERMAKRQYPPRQWALIGHPTSGNGKQVSRVQEPEF